MAEEARTFWDYYFRDAPSISGLSWTNLEEMRVLLGCGVAGGSVARYRGIEVVSGPGRLIVRYVFAMPPNAEMLMATYVVPAMQSVFVNLRSRTIRDAPPLKGGSFRIHSSWCFK